MHPTRSYLVCATPRSGSTLLCELLARTGFVYDQEGPLGQLVVAAPWSTAIDAVFLNAFR